jgi:IS30 family transposase
MFVFSQSYSLYSQHIYNKECRELKQLLKDTVCKEEIISIQDKLNHRPRKILNYKTPYEVFFTEFAKALAA